MDDANWLPMISEYLVERGQQIIAFGRAKKPSRGQLLIVSFILPTLIPP